MKFHAQGPGFLSIKHNSLDYKKYSFAIKDYS